MSDRSGRQNVIAGNWKMHKDHLAAARLASEVRAACAGSAATVVVAPPFTALAAVAAELQGSEVALAAQNVSAHGEGAHTGEVAASMLLAHGVRWVIVGHSERRQLYGETDADVAPKVQAALAAGLLPILCVGETLAERDAGRAEQVVADQLRGCCSELTARQSATMCVAYEPVWAIGTGRTATPDDAGAMHRSIRAWWSEQYGSESAEGVPLLYGGSVKPENAAALLSDADIDGALVGGASLDVQDFAAIVSTVG